MVEKNHWFLFWRGIVACIPTLLGYWAIGFACGAIGAVSGFTIWQIFCLSAFVYAGSAQFLFYSMASTGAGLVQIALGVLFINMRYLLINTYMAQFFSHTNLVEKLIGGFLMTDETFGVASQYARQHNHILPFSWLLGLNVTAWLNWISATLVGGLFATSLPDWLKDSLSFSLVGMFIGLLLLGWYASQTKKIDIVVIIVAMAIVTFSKGLIAANPSSIVATMIAATIGMFLLLQTGTREKL
ncbi:AzlC family ABC transporter permease [uncultured Bartonella sp.]|uniref:AzlC family ABC transporter permease n=1 Tax=uncultured Bartonella sp. TaxID=104108 RepID=UPI0025F686EA|nr:AzlC family ABC transporter permease [uncultured Bartonella sp.]